MAEEVYKSPEVFKKPIKLPKVESSEKGALSTTAPQEDPVYRKKVYNFLKRELSDFKLSEDDFYKKLDTDQAYAPKVYSFLKNNFSDFTKPEQDFLFLMTPSKKKTKSQQFLYLLEKNCQRLVAALPHPHLHLNLN